MTNKKQNSLPMKWPTTDMWNQSDFFFPQHFFIPRIKKRKVSTIVPHAIKPNADCRAHAKIGTKFYIKKLIKIVNNVIIGTSNMHVLHSQNKFKLCVMNLQIFKILKIQTFVCEKPNHRYIIVYRHPYSSSETECHGNEWTGQADLLSCFH